MDIAIFGNGQVGQALAQALRRAGRSLVFGLRNPGADAPDELSLADAAAGAGICILAVPFGAVADVIRAAQGFAGKVVIDATNPLAFGADGLGLTLGFNTSGGEAIQRLAPEAKVFKTFNQTGFENIADVGPYVARPVMFVAGDDAAAKPAVLRLVADAGFEAVDAGDLVRSRLLEPLAMLWIELARKRGQGPDFSFSLQRKGPS
jgi:predicted dinucleotide-binding enzyme